MAAPDAASAVAHQSHTDTGTTTFTGALRLESLTAPMVLDGPMDAAAFGTDAETLRRALGHFDAALDETVVRAVVTRETTAAYLELLHAAAPE